MVIDKLLLASDHAGLSLKNAVKKYLYSAGKPVEDLGVHTEDSVDYPDLAQYLADKIENGEVSRGILVCGTGIGMSIAANRYPSVRAAVVSELYSARMSRMHNDSNVLCLGSRVLTPELACEIVKVWMDTPFEGGRHAARVKKLSRRL